MAERFNPLDPLGIIGETKKQVDRFAARSGLPTLPGLSNSNGDLQSEVRKRGLKSTYVWAVYVDGELSDWNSGTLDFIRAQMAPAFSREMVNPRNSGLEIIGELYSIDDRGKITTIPGERHGRAR